LRQVFANVLATGGHVRVQFKRLQMNLRGHLGLHLLQRLLQRRQANGAPRAGDI